ncbi:MAG TPA: hypothetical protein PKD09_13965 [Aggregatilinea sp.]|jgi:hypothetical protein|uniref:hypothetical protein n=1 Tax=Aggregatilinea sp. TaxID=2806333 RepID=UPI002CE6EE68|nr:hypothetical protein [Aggregatilinea sp.]HML22751.1 hypothetical protein [Aggregatilinea sp.]
MSKKMLLAMVMVVVLALGAASSAFADGDTDTYGAVIEDGRLNKTDLSAPLAVYYSTVEKMGYDEDLEWDYVYNEITGIEIWAIDSDSNGYKTFSVTLDQINAALAATANDYVVFQQGDYSIGYSESGWYWVTGPNGYEFTWEAEA